MCLRLTKRSVDLIMYSLGLDHELCGYAKEQDGILDLIFTTRGKSSSCIQSTRHKIIWHSHKKLGKNYPSDKDILKVIEHRNVTTSIIFTTAGIWVLRASEEKKFVKEKDKLQKANYDYYYNSDGGMFLNTRYINYEYMPRLRELLGKYGFKISFCPWGDVI